MKKSYYTTRETGDKLGVTKCTILNWIKSKLLPEKSYIKENRNHLFKASYVDGVVDCLEAQTLFTKTPTIEELEEAVIMKRRIEHGYKNK